MGERPSYDLPQEQDESFVRRWSRRKLEHREAGAVPAPVSPPPPGEPCREAPGDADLPSLEELDEQSDYSGFLSPRVSSELKRLALRKLFHSPRYQTRCLLNEYEGSFNDYLPLGDMLTRELRYRLEVEAGRPLADAVQVPPAGPGAGDDPGPGHPPDPSGSPEPGEETL